MKLFTALVLAIALVMLYGGTSRAQQPTFAMIGNPCSSSPQFGGAQWCFDAVNAATHNVYYWNGTGWTQSATSFTTLTATSAALSGTADETLSLTQNGHISSLLGAAALPTVGTGTVTAGGTDNAMRVTGATSPVTVTFTVAFHAAPICVCSNESTPAHGCGAVSTTGNVAVTTAGTDTFDMVCIGK